jgi:hypothetical protein
MTVMPRGPENDTDAQFDHRPRVLARGPSGSKWITFAAGQSRIGNATLIKLPIELSMIDQGVPARHSPNLIADVSLLKSTHCFSESLYRATPHSEILPHLSLAVSKRNILLLGQYGSAYSEVAIPISHCTLTEGDCMDMDLHVKPANGTQFVLEEYGGIVLDSHGVMFTISAVGGRIWERMIDGITVADLAQSIASEFSLCPEQAFIDTVAFLNELEARRLIDVGSQTL